MPQQETHDDIDDAVEAALSSVPSDPQLETSARELAEIEEKLAADRIAQANRAAEDASQLTPQAEENLAELPMVSVLAKGRQALEEAMRQHQAKKDAEPPYVPPPMSANQRARHEEEMAAGRKTAERHAAQVAEQRRLAAEQNKQDPAEGTSTPVHRPGMLVPNPKGGHGVFSPEA